MQTLMGAVSRGLLGAGVLMALALTSSCGRPNKLEIGGFENYVDRFEQAASSYGQPVQVDDLVIKFGDISNPAQIAVCRISGSETPTITLRKNVWDRFTDKDREALLFHEMGHCVFRRDHREGEVPGTSLPVSLMNPFVLKDYQYVPNEPYYKTELNSRKNEI